MKKAIYALAAMAALTLASCSSEDAVTAPTGDGTVTFTAELPAMASRAFADGTTAAKLAYYVYDAEATGDTKTVLFDGTADFDGLHATVQLALVTGKTYDIVFWADSYGKDAADKPYTYDGATQTVTVSYGTAANDEARDAFYYTRAGLKVTGAVSETVTLRRPFAQLNIGTSDLEAAKKAGMTLSETGLYIADMPDALNLYDGTVSGSAEARFTAATLPEGEDFPVEPAKYGYLTMNYILVGADKTTVDVHLTSDINASADRQDVAFTAVPVQRNHRTNIYGALLTNPAIFDVEINPDFEGEYLPVWVSTTDELKAALNSGKQNICLNPGEYELGGATFTADAVITGSDKTACKIKMQKSVYPENKSLTLNNLTYSVPTGLTYNESAFGFIHRAKSLVINDCVIDGSLRLNVSNAIVENCTFNVAVSSGFDGYGLFYYGANNSNVSVKNCTFETKGKAIVIYSERATVYNLDVESCTFISSDSSTDKAAIQMHTEYGISGTLDIVNSTAIDFKDVNNGLWNEVNNQTQEVTNKFTVTVK